MCPNLEIFVVDWPMWTAFGRVADALCTYCAKSLRSVHWQVPSEALPKVIWSLDTLQSLRSAYIEIEAPTNETLHFGSAAGLHLELGNLQQLCLRGHVQDFVEQVAGWSLPSLRSLSLDFFKTNDLPDIIEFLAQHGSQLTFLDLNCVPTLDTAAILDLCPFLTTFTFNADWYLSIPGDNAPSDAITFVNRPHQNITYIGCHGLLDAFGVGYGSEIHMRLFQRANEKNMAALTKVNFPNLKIVRVLSRTLLRSLEKNDGPEQECLQRWDRWWTQFTRMGVRLEDCTGAMLGTLPQEEGMDDNESDDSDEGTESEDEDGDEVVVEGPRLGDGTINELRQLLEECWKMSEDREERNFPQVGWQ